MILTVFISNKDSFTDNVNPLGEVTFNISILKLQNLTLPAFKTKLLSGKGLALFFSESNSFIHFDWSMSSFLLKDKGSGEVIINNSSIYIPISITEKEGRPQLHAHDVKVDLGKLELVLHGGSTWLYDIFKSIFEGEMKGLIETSLAEVLTNVINEEEKLIVRTIPLTQNLGQVEISLLLSQNPTFTETYMSVDLKGEFYDKKDPSPTPFPINPLPFKINEADLQIFISDFFFTSAGYAYWKTGQLNFQVFSYQIPTSAPFQLDTANFSKIIPQLYAKVIFSDLSYCPFFGNFLKQVSKFASRC